MRKFLLVQTVTKRCPPWVKCKYMSQQWQDREAFITLWRSNGWHVSPIQDSPPQFPSPVSDGLYHGPAKGILVCIYLKRLQPSQNQKLSVQTLHPSIIIKLLLSKEKEKSKQSSISQLKQSISQETLSSVIHFYKDNSAGICKWVSKNNPLQRCFFMRTVSSLYYKS